MTENDHSPKKNHNSKLSKIPSIMKTQPVNAPSTTVHNYTNFLAMGISMPP